MYQIQGFVDSQDSFADIQGFVVDIEGSFARM